MRPVRIVALALLVLAAAAIAGVGQPEAVRTASADPEAPPRTVTTSGSASVSAVPDRATFTFGVETRAANASEALAQASAAAGRVAAAARSAGVRDRDIQTQHVSLYPVTSSDGRNIDGFAAGTSITARVGDLDRAGALVDAAVAAGANTVYGPSLDRSDASALAHRALGDAVEDARRKAEALARAAGGSVGEVVSVTETGGSTPPVPYAAAAREALAADVPIEPGRQEIQVSVTVTFALR